MPIAHVKLPDDGNINKQNPDPRNPNDPPVIVPPPKIDPPIVKPGQPLPDAINPNQVPRVKQSTVYLRVTMPSGQVAEGSGFFAVEPRIVVTNAHVLGMLQASSKPPRQVEVTLHSGEPNQLKLTGEVLGVDRASDLAIVRVPPNAGLPSPLQLENERKLIETQPVYIFGFPLGAQLGANITVSASTVSSLRKTRTPAHSSRFKSTAACTPAIGRPGRQCRGQCRRRRGGGNQGDADQFCSSLGKRAHDHGRPI